MADDIQTKICAKCKRDFPLDRFHRRSDGARATHRSRCKECATEDRKPLLGTIRNRSRKWRADDPERSKAANRKSRAKHSEARNASKSAYLKTPRGRAFQARMYQKHRAKRLAEQKARDAKRPMELRKYRSQYWREHPEKAREYWNRRRALKLAADGTHTAADLLEIRRRQKDRCAVCKTALNDKGHFDHRHALVSGGSNDKKNMQLLCASCNAKKRAKDELDFMREQGFLL